MEDRKGMKHMERELANIKDTVNEMWRLVISQLEKAKQSFLTGDVDLGHEVMSRERRINAYELKIDSDCENYIALFAPVAVDLRLVLSLIKISNTLERIGDFANGVAIHVVKDDCIAFTKALSEELRMEELFDVLLRMLTDSFVLLQSENTQLVGRILAQDDTVDQIYDDSIEVLSNYLANHTDQTPCGLKTLLLIRKLERIGDHCSNIVEEIVFYVDAKVLKHGGKTVPLDRESKE
ncbi:MAG: phosphate signaling complex protein PhoU [Fermentimonas sp.]|nr:phosphate signaling complex protein PhoU [Fermentimonas sp.]